MFCHNCGRQCDNSRFCPACGTKLIQNMQAPQEPQIPVQPPVQPIVEPVVEPVVEATPIPVVEEAVSEIPVEKPFVEAEVEPISPPVADEAIVELPAEEPVAEPIVDDTIAELPSTEPTAEPVVESDSAPVADYSKYSPFTNEQSLASPVQQNTHPVNPYATQQVPFSAQQEPVVNQQTPYSAQQSPYATQQFPINNQSLQNNGVENGSQQITGEVVSKKKKSPIKKILLALVSLILVAAIALVSVSVAFVSKPKNKIELAMVNFLLNTESFEFDFEMEGYSERSIYEEAEGYYDYYGEEGTWETDSYSSTTSIKGALAYGEDLFSSSFFIEAGVEENDEFYDAFKAVSNGGEALLIIEPGDDNLALSGNLPALYSEIKEKPDTLVEDVIGEDYDDFVDLLDDELQLTPEQIFAWADSIVVGNKINSKLFGQVYDEWGRKVLAEEVLDESEEDLPDYKTVRKILVDFLLNGLSDDAFEISDKTKKDGIEYYEITPNVEVLFSDAFAFIEGCEELQSLLDTDMGEEFMEEFEDLLDEIEDMDEIEVQPYTIGIEGGRFVYFHQENEYEFEEENYKRKTEASITLQIKSVNKNIDFKSAYDDVYDIVDNDNLIEIKKLKDIDI